MKYLIRLLVFTVLLSSCSAQEPVTEKINGVSFVANRSPVDSTHVAPLLEIHANHAAVMPFGFIPDLDKPQLVYNSDRQWYGETREGGRNYITQLHRGGIQVMLKPQLWIRHGEFTGYLKMPTEEAWVALENSYKEFILDYARLAAEENTALFCIGTELEQFVVQRPAFWNALIAEIKTIYKGKLTYAANWDEYKRVPFWDQLDYIGIDAYFPVCEAETPTVGCAIQGWQRWKNEVSAFAKAQDLSVLFTEFGYRSVDFSGKEPWKADWRDQTPVNLEAQAHLLQAVFDTVWDQEWMAGGFIWKWFIHHEEAGGVDNNRFTPQNKPAQEVLKRVYERY